MTLTASTSVTTTPKSENNNNNSIMQQTPQGIRATPASVLSTPINGTTNPIAIPVRYTPIAAITPPNSAAYDHHHHHHHHNTGYIVHQQQQQQQQHHHYPTNGTPTNQQFFIAQPHQLQFTTTPAQMMAAAAGTPTTYTAYYSNTTRPTLYHHHPANNNNATAGGQHVTRVPTHLHHQIAIDVTSTPIQPTTAPFIHALATVNPSQQMPSQITSPAASNHESIENEQNFSLNVNSSSNNSSSNNHYNNNRHHHHHHHYHNDRHNNNNNNNSSSSSGEHTSKTNLYIRGLSPETTDNDLHEMCKSYGQIKSTKAIIDKQTQKCKGYGFVDYISPDDALVALRELKKDDKDVQLAKQREQDPTNLYFANLPSNIDEKALTDMLSKRFNVNVNSTRIMRERSGDSKGVGFARIEESKVCERIIQELNSKPFPGDTNMNKLLLVKLADSGNNKKQRNNSSSNNNTANGYTSVSGGGSNSMNNSSTSTSGSSNNNGNNNNHNASASANTSTNSSNGNQNGSHMSNSNNSSHFQSPTANFNGFPIVIDQQHNQLLLHPHQIVDPSSGYMPQQIIHQLPPPSAHHQRAYVQYAAANTAAAAAHPSPGLPGTYLIIPQMAHHQLQQQQQQQQHMQQQQQQLVQSTANSSSTANTNQPNEQQQQQSQPQQQQQQQNTNNSTTPLYPMQTIQQQFANIAINPHHVITSHAQPHHPQCITTHTLPGAPHPIQLIPHQLQPPAEMYSNSYTN